MKKEMLEKVYNAQKNIIVSGDMAAGKTTSVLFPLVDKMIEQQESLMILDSKEEYINKYYKNLKEKNYNIIVLNLRDLDKSDGWNPIQIAYELYKDGDTDKAMDYIDKVAKTMFYYESSVGSFCESAVSDFFTGIVLALFEDADKDEINFNSVSMILEGINEKFGTSDYLTNYFKLKDSNLQSYFSTSTTALASKETIISVVKQRLRPYVSREKLSIFMNKTTFNYKDIATKPTAIFFIAKDENKHLNALAAMFIEQLFTVLFDMFDVKSSNKFNFILDNFDIIEKINEFTDMLSSGISKRIKFTISTRSLEDLSAKYGNYITKLSNIIYVVAGLLKVKIDDKDETIENKFEKIIDVYNEVYYPKLNPVSIKVFDLKKFVKEANKLSIEDVLNDFPPSPIPFSPMINNSDKDMDEFLKKIDDEIEKLSAEKQEVKVESETAKLKRIKLEKITQQFIDDTNEFEIFKIPDKLYLDYFEQIKKLFTNHKFDEDYRFFTCGRLDFLKNELTERLNDTNLEKEDLNWKDKWDNRLGAFWDLYDYIRGDRHFTPADIPDGMNYRDMLIMNNKYYEDGYVCKQEKDILLEMINEISLFIESKQNKKNEASPISKKLILKIEEHDWGQKTIYSWNTKIWYIYDDLSIEFKIRNGEDKIKSYSHNINALDLQQIFKNIELAKLDNHVVKALDGKAWEFIQYKDNVIIWERKLGYIYGIEPLENICDILLNLVKQDSDIFTDI